MEKRHDGSRTQAAQRHAAPPRSWTMLAYRLPREPSTPRISVWRKLRRLGAAQIVDGLVALPSENRTREQLAWLAEEIRESAGEAWHWESSFASRAQERTLVETMSRELEQEYGGLARKADEALGDDAVGARTLARLRRELHRIEARDYFGVAARRDARRAIDTLARRLEVVTT
jgi:hypothetical protein